jgi:hypothetical protein
MKCETTLISMYILIIQRVCIHTSAQSAYLILTMSEEIIMSTKIKIRALWDVELCSFGEDSHSAVSQKALNFIPATVRT